MNYGLRYNIIILFILLNTISVALYIGFFSWYLLSIHTSAFIISSLIGSTTLLAIFWGPVAGKFIDNYHHKSFLLSISLTASAICILLFGKLHHYHYLITPTLVLTFSLCLNFSMIIINQYVLPFLTHSFELSISKASQFEGGGLILSGIFLSFFYDYIPSIYILPG